MLRAFGPLGGEGPSRAFTRFFAGHSNACTNACPQPLPHCFSMHPLSTVPLSRKGVLPPPPPSLRALFCRQVHLHYVNDGLTTRPACSAHWSVPTTARPLAEAIPNCYGHLVLEVNKIGQHQHLHPNAQLPKGTTAATWLLCLLCAVPSQLC